MNISEYCKYAWFSDLAYVEWDGGHLVGTDAIDAAIAAKRIPQKLGEKIFTKENFSVLSYCPNDDYGFKASLYGKGSEKVLAICGTEGLDDLDDWTDGNSDIAKYGISIHQAVSLFNYIMRLKADKDDEGVLQLLEFPAGNFPSFVPVYTGKGEGKLKPGDKITLTGHSLGGHLAALALRLFPNLFDQAVTFNMAGFDPATNPFHLQWTDEIVGLFSKFLSVPSATSFSEVSNRLHVLESESSSPGNDPSIVAGIICGISPKQETYVTTEKNSHSMDQFLDALAVQALLEKLNPAWGLEETGKLICAASNKEGDSEERIVNALSAILLREEKAKPVLNGEASIKNSASFDTRGSLHKKGSSLPLTLI